MLRDLREKKIEMASVSILDTVPAGTVVPYRIRKYQTVFFE